MIWRKIQAIINALRGNPAPPKPSVIYTISAFDFAHQLGELGIYAINQAQPLEDDFRYTNGTEWQKVLTYLGFDPLYYHGTFTCGDYALLAASLCSLNTTLNGLRPAYGWDKDRKTRHAFNLVPIGTANGKVDKFMLWEPNLGAIFAGEMFNIGDHDYHPDGVLL